MREDVAVVDLRVGDEIAVLPHEICPVDGDVTQGRGRMDESYLTGEPFAIAKGPGAQVLSARSTARRRCACGRRGWPRIRATRRS